MKSSPDAALEGPFRAPERLALALPLLSIIGLMMVVGAAATGQSALVVALAGVAGFGLTALAPMAMLELYLGRPLRALVTQLRAARDGREPGPTPPGVVADLVAVARDIAAKRAQADDLGVALGRYEQMAAAGDEAIRAFRLQCEELAETKVQAESELRRAAQAQFAEISEALKAIRVEPAAATGAPDAAMERVEQMLVYLADLIERRDPGEGLTPALDEIVRLIGREAQALRDSVGAAAQTVRNDVAGLGADERAAESRQAERLDALEARLTSRLAAPETAGLPHLMRAEAETTRQTLLARVSAVLEAAPREPADLAERWRDHAQAQAARLEEIEANVARRVLAGEGEAKTLAGLVRTADKLRNAIDRLDALSASAATVVAMQNDDVKAMLRTLEGEVSGLGGRLDETLEARTKAILARLDASDAAFETQASEWTLAASVDAQTLAALRADVGTVKARVAEIAPRVVAANENLAQSLAERFGSLDAGPLEAAARDLAEAQARAHAHAEALGALAAREAQDFAGLAQASGEAAARLHEKLEALEADALREPLAQVAQVLEALRSEREALASREAQDFAGLAQASGEAAARLYENLEALEADALREPLAQVAQVLEALRGEREAMASREAQDFAGLAQASGEAAARLYEKLEALEADALREPLTQVAQLLEALRAEREALAGRDAAALAQPLDSLRADLAVRAQALDGRLADLVASGGEQAALWRASVAQTSDLGARLLSALHGLEDRISDDARTTLGGLDAKLSELVAATPDPGAFGARFDAFAADLCARVEALDLRLSARAGGLDRTAVASALTVFKTMTRSFAAALERLEAAAQAMEALRPQDDALREDLRAAVGGVAEASERLDGRFDAFLDAHADRLDRLETRIVGAGAALDRSGVAAALTVFRALSRDLQKALAGLAPAAGGEAVTQAVENAAARLEARLDAFSAAQEERLIGLETRVSGRNLSLDRTATASALTVFRTLSRDFAAALARLEAASGALEGRAAPNALAQAMAHSAQRLDEMAREQSERLQAIELRLAARGVSRERTDVASALVAFRGMMRALKDAVGRFEAATQDLRERPAPGDAGDWRGDLGALAGELAEIGGRLDAFAHTHADGLAELAARLPGPTLEGRIVEIAEKLEGGAGVQALDARLADLQRRLDAPRPAAEYSSPIDPKTSGAVARIVMSLADSLDFRFVQIEKTVEDLFEKLSTAQNNSTAEAGMTDLAKQIQSAAEVLKTGLSDFVGVSAALVEDIDARNRNSGEPQMQKMRQ